MTDEFKGSGRRKLSFVMIMIQSVLRRFILVTKDYEHKLWSTEREISISLPVLQAHNRTHNRTHNRIRTQAHTCIKNARCNMHAGMYIHSRQGGTSALVRTLEFQNH